MQLLRHRYSPDFQNLAAALNGAPLPYINGTWYFVNPDTGDNDRDGLTLEEAVADLKTAYDRCTSGVGDGIVLLSAGTAVGDTTSLLKFPLAWSKHGITTVGIAAPIAMFGRARVASAPTTETASLTTCAQAAHAITREAGSFLTDGWEAGMTGVIVDSGSNNGATFTVTVAEALSLTVSETLNVQAKASTVSTTLTSYLASLVNLTGKNNTFLNTFFVNEDSHVRSVGCVNDAAGRNYFQNCHFIGGCHATPGAAVGVNDFAFDANEEDTFVSCTFGTDTIARTGAVNANLLYDGGAWRTRFYDCDFVRQGTTTSAGFIKSADATSMSGIHVFSRCRFMNWTPNGLTDLLSAFVGTKPNSGQFLMDGCSLVGCAAWDAQAANNTVYVANSDATASGAGGIATTV